jgi:hypothetical protein
MWPPLSAWSKQEKSFSPFKVRIWPSSWERASGRLNEKCKEHFSVDKVSTIKTLTRKWTHGMERHISVTQL